MSEPASAYPEVQFLQRLPARSRKIGSFLIHQHLLDATRKLGCCILTATCPDGLAVVELLLSFEDLNAVEVAGAEAAREHQAYGTLGLSKEPEKLRTYCIPSFAIDFYVLFGRPTLVTGPVYTPARFVRGQRGIRFLAWRPLQHTEAPNCTPESGVARPSEDVAALEATSV